MSTRYDYIVPRSSKSEHRHHLSPARDILLRRDCVELSRSKSCHLDFIAERLSCPNNSRNLASYHLLGRGHYCLNGAGVRFYGGNPWFALLNNHSNNQNHHHKCTIMTMLSYFPRGQCHLRGLWYGPLVVLMLSVIFVIFKYQSL